LRSYPGIEKLVVLAESDDSGAEDRDKRAFLQKALDLAPEITGRGRKGDRCGGIHGAVCKEIHWRHVCSKDTSFAKSSPLRRSPKTKNFRRTTTIRMCTDGCSNNFLPDCQVAWRSGIVVRRDDNSQCFFSAKRSLSSLPERATSFLGIFSSFKFRLRSKSDRLLEALQKSLEECHARFEIGDGNPLIGRMGLLDRAWSEGNGRRACRRKQSRIAEPRCTGTMRPARFQ
jgi:hypothetical protein